MNFSVVTICRNEAKTLPRLIGSLKQFQERGGEIICLDTGSTDGTAQIARDLGCTVEEVGDKFRVQIDANLAKKINKKFIEKGKGDVVKAGDSLFDFSSARNYAASLASNNLVSMPDCDEIFTQLDLEKIEQAIADGAQQLEYQFVFSHDQFGKPAVKFLHCKFYDRTKLKWTGVIHEVLTGAARRQYLGEEIIKLEHYQNLETNRGGYLKGLALDCFLNPENDRNAHYLARELMWTGRVDSAIKEFKRHIEMDKWSAERAQSLVFIGDCYLQKNNEEKAIEYWLKAFDLDPTRRIALMRLATHYFTKEQWQKAICYLGAALEIGHHSFYANDMAEYAHRPHELMYLSKWKIGDFAGAAYHFEKALQYQPLNGKFLFDYRFFYQLPKVSILLPTLGRPEGLKRCLNSIEKLNYPKELIEIQCEEDEPRMGVPKRVKKLQQQASGDVYVFAANDIEFTPDALIHAVIASKEKGLVAFNDGPVLEDKGNICCHFLIRKDMLKYLQNEEIFDTELYHTGADNWLYAQLNKLGEFTRCEAAQINHYHFSRGTAEFDSVNALGWKEDMRKKDLELLEKKLATIK